VVTTSTLISKVTTHRQPKFHSFQIFPHRQKQKDETTKDTSVFKQQQHLKPVHRYPQKKSWVRLKEDELYLFSLSSRCICILEWILAHMIWTFAVYALKLLH